MTKYLKSCTDMIGKTVKNISFRNISKEFDDVPFFDIYFTDGTKITIEAHYGGYTGQSEDEYIRFIKVGEDESI